MTLDSIRNAFPILTKCVNGKPYVYLDNAATTQKPTKVIDTIKRYYQESNANVHRAGHHLAAEATRQFESARIAAQSFINAKHCHEIIWTSGTTEGINLVAHSWGHKSLLPGDEIIISQAEHHANIVPWQQLISSNGVKLKIVSLNENGTVNLEHLSKLLNKNTKLVAVHHISNVIGKINPIKEISKITKGFKAKLLIDAAQSVAHIDIDVQDIDCDFLVFSAHKMYGPTGVGCLYGKSELLEQMPPVNTGGEMIKKVSFTSGTTFNELPFKFEPGTPNISGVIGFKEAITFVRSLRGIYDEEKHLIEYAYKKINNIPLLKMLVKKQPDIGIFSFVVEGHHPQDIASFLDSKGIAVRVGHHCAMPLMEYFQLTGCVRISMAHYTSKIEIDYVTEQLESYCQQGKDLESTEIIVSPFNEQLTSIKALFGKIKGWDAKHRQIMLLGKELSRMPMEFRSNDTLIEGCESSAWLKIDRQVGGTIRFSADSDAKIIRGLLVIVLAAVNDESIKTIHQFDFESYFEELGLLQHLSPSRGNGLLAIVDKIKIMTI